MPRSRGQTLNLRHSGIVVADLTRSLRFYRDLLGFKPWREAVESGPLIDAVVGIKGAKLRWVKLKGPDGKGLIELLQYLSHPRKPRRFKSNDIGPSHIAVTVRDVDALCREFRRRGLKVNADPVVSPDGGAKVAYAHDPDGAIVEIVEEL